MRLGGKTSVAPTRRARGRVGIISIHDGEAASFRGARAVCPFPGNVTRGRAGRVVDADV